MKIGLVVPGGFDREGTDKEIPALVALAERLSRRHQVTAVVLWQEPEPSRYRLHGADVVNLGHIPGGRRGFVYREHYQRMVEALGDEGPKFDALHAFWIGDCGLLAGLAGRRWNVPVLMSVGGGELASVTEIGYGGWSDPQRQKQVSLAIRLADRLTAGSRYAALPLEELGMDVVLVPLGVDAAAFDGPAARPSGPPWRLLHVANLNEVKNQGMLLDAVLKISRQLSGVRLDVLGADWLNAAVQRRAGELGLRDIVHFHGLLPNDALASFYRQAHLLLQSSWHESQGVAVCEAAAAGVPTVGTAVGLVAELAPAAAVAVSHGDAHSMAKAAVGLLRNDARREALGRAAQRWAREHDADWTARTFEAVYRQLASG